MEMVTMGNINNTQNTCGVVYIMEHNRLDNSYSPPSFPEEKNLQMTR